MIWSEVERENFEAATKCHISGAQFKDKYNTNRAHVAQKTNYTLE